MNELLARLKQRKLVQWAITYVAFAFALIQVIDVVSDSYGWPHMVMHLVFGLLALGFIVMLLLAWYHGEKGRQWVSGAELLLIALVLAVGGGLLWQFGRPALPAVNAKVAQTGRTVAVKHHPLKSRGPEGAMRHPEKSAPDSAALAAASGSPTAPASAAAQPIPPKSIAVLPFENLSDDKMNAYFVAGMQDLILTKLADVGNLKVISRTSTMRYRSHPDDLKTIGRQLGVATILEGSVQKQGNQVLINVQLIDAKTDNHIWAQVYTRKLDNIFGVEGEVAGKIAQALNAKLSPAQTEQLAGVPTTDPAAYDAFLRAEYQVSRFWLSDPTADFKAAISLYRQAVAQDPGFALAWARLSFSESMLVRWGGGSEEEPLKLIEHARADAERALKLAPGMSAAHIAIGYSDFYGKRDYAAALKAFDAALAIRPNDADALAACGYVERQQGRFDDGIASLKQALSYDPRNSGLAYEIGNTWLWIRRYAEAEPWFQRALALDPNSLAARYRESQLILYRSGDVARALAAAKGERPALKSLRVYFLKLQRNYGKAIALLQTMPDTPELFATGDPKDLELANLYRLAGDPAKARPLYAEVLPKIRAELARQQGLNPALASVWQGVARAELGLGDIAQGLKAADKARAAGAKVKDLVARSSRSITTADLYAEVGRPDLAVPVLAKTLATPGLGAHYAPVLLWIDPAWDPLLHDPGFQALLKKYASYKPAVIPAAAYPSGGAPMPVTGGGADHA
ncbi:MAG: tetratricopeptide repeat protein [Rhodanobacteraceae bacterium]